MDDNCANRLFGFVQLVLTEKDEREKRTFSYCHES